MSPDNAHAAYICGITIQQIRGSCYVIHIRKLEMGKVYPKIVNTYQRDNCATICQEHLDCTNEDKNIMKKL